MRQETENALCRSAVYAALSLGFGPPNDEVALRLLSADGARFLHSLLLSLGCHRAFAPPQTGSLGERYAELFGHTVRGRVTPYETEYGQDSLFVQSRELADLGAFLSAFGLVLERGEHERVDHVRCHCELMAFLCRKEAYALGNGDQEALSQTRAAQRMFLREHLGRFAPCLGAQLSREDPGGFYGSLGQVLQSFVEQECARLGVPAGPEELALRVYTQDAVPMACAECRTGEPSP